MPIQRRVPKRGFTNIFRLEYQPVNVGQLAAGESEVTENCTRTDHSQAQPAVKLLGDSSRTALTVRVDACSAKARELIEKAGGTVEVAA
jgi:large subunit ribosomal protein L15